MQPQRPENLKPIEILLVEDNPGDIRLTLEAFKEGKCNNRIQVARDGEEAMQYLRKQGRHAESPRPDLILLDLNLPKRDGRSILQEIKTDPDLMRIPVVILTTSKAEEDILKTYNLHANCYITKPVEIEEFIVITRSIENFWLSIVSLPDR
jgi:two-component system, chemotaxis family, response regulator Rcp1